MDSLLRVMYAPLDYVHPQRFPKEGVVKDPEGSTLGISGARRTSRTSSLLDPNLDPSGSFTTPSKFAGVSSSVQQALNHHLIRQYQLSTAIDFTVSPQDFSQRLVANWSLIPQVAWLLGCKIARGSLAMTGQLAALPSVVHKFIALPIPCPAYPADVPLSKSDIEQLGARYLNQLQPQLPRALAERLPLVFAPDDNLDAAKSAAMPALTMNRSLFTFAFDYAQNPSN